MRQAFRNEMTTSLDYVGVITLVTTFNRSFYTLAEIYSIILSDFILTMDFF